MRSIVFSNYVAKDTRRLGATIDVEHSHVRFLGNLTLNLWDCGGCVCPCLSITPSPPPSPTHNLTWHSQDAFMENYLAQQRDHIFKNVEVLIYVFDIESREFERDLITYSSCIEALRDNSSSALIFCLVHKMDLVQNEMRERLFLERSAVLRERSRGMEIVCYPTSIWDETLYKARIPPPPPCVFLAVD